MEIPCVLGLSLCIVDIKEPLSRHRQGMSRVERKRVSEFEKERSGVAGRFRFEDNASASEFGWEPGGVDTTVQTLRAAKETGIAHTSLLPLQLPRQMLHPSLVALATFGATAA